MLATKACWLAGAVASVHGTARFVDPYPEIFPTVARPKFAVSAAVYTGDPTKVLTTHIGAHNNP